LIVCADWSSLPTGRAAWGIDLGERAIFPLAERARSWTLAGLLEEAGALAGGDSCLVSIDAPLGVPSSFLEAAGATSFPEWLAGEAAGALAAPPALDPAEWSAARPFFRVAKGPGGLTRFVDAARGQGVDLWRRIDRATQAKSMFAIGLPGHVAPSTRSLWSEIREARASGIDFALWPFEDGLSTVTLAEIYPRAAYGVALAPSLPSRPRAVAKTKVAARQAALEELGGCGWLQDARVRVLEPDRPRADEDDFDAFFTGAALLRLVLEGLPLATEVDARAEGAMLGL